MGNRIEIFEWALLNPLKVIWTKSTESISCAVGACIGNVLQFLVNSQHSLISDYTAKLQKSKCMVLAQKQILRSMEQDRGPRNKSTG